MFPKGVSFTAQSLSNIEFPWKFELVSLKTVSVSLQSAMDSNGLCSEQLDKMFSCVLDGAIASRDSILLLILWLPKIFQPGGNWTTVVSLPTQIREECLPIYLIWDDTSVWKIPLVGFRACSNGFFPFGSPECCNSRAMLLFGCPLTAALMATSIARALASWAAPEDFQAGLV